MQREMLESQLEAQTAAGREVKGRLDAALQELCAAATPSDPRLLHILRARRPVHPPPAPARGPLSAVPPSPPTCPCVIAACACQVGTLVRREAPAATAARRSAAPCRWPWARAARALRGGARRMTWHWPASARAPRSLPLRCPPPPPLHLPLARRHVRVIALCNRQLAQLPFDLHLHHLPPSILWLHGRPSTRALISLR